MALEQDFKNRGRMLVGKGRTGFCFILEKVEGSEVLGSEGLQNSLKQAKGTSLYLSSEDFGTGLFPKLKVVFQ